VKVKRVVWNGSSIRVLDEGALVGA
jgi:hypothetical protein